MCRQQAAAMRRVVTLWLVVCASLHARTDAPGRRHGDMAGKFPRHLRREQDYPHALVRRQTAQPTIDLFPPKWFPGDVLHKMGHADVTKALDDVMKAGTLLQDRRCAIGIANVGRSSRLMNPTWWLYSGQIHSAMPYQVDGNHTSMTLFVKQTGLAAGTVGVLSYDIEDTDFKVVIMWSVPFDFNIFDVWFNMKVYPQSVVTDWALWRHLYYDAGPWRANGWKSRDEYGVQVRGVMTDHTYSKLIVWVNADQLDINGDYDLFVDCPYHPGRVGTYCTQECHGGGWCWVDKKCDSAAQCVGRHPCQGQC